MGTPIHMGPGSVGAAGGSGEGRSDPYTSWSDDVLVLAHQRGDTSAFVVLTRRYWNVLYTFLWQQLRQSQDAEEVLSDTWLAVHQHTGKYQGKGQFRAWIYQIARHKLVDHRRRCQRWRRETPSEEIPWEQMSAGSPEDPESALATARQMAVLDGCLKRQPEPRRTAFMLSEFHGLSAAEIGAVLGLTDGTVSVYVSSVRKVLFQVSQQADP